MVKNVSALQKFLHFHSTDKSLQRNYIYTAQIKAFKEIKSKTSNHSLYRMKLVK